MQDTSGNSYQTIQIGNQIWMAENLRDYPTNLAGGIFPPNGGQNNVAQYGYLYTWDTARTIASKIPGWRLPTKDDFTDLLNYVKRHNPSCSEFDSLASHNWSILHSGKNAFGFNALPAGEYNGSYSGFYFHGYWWTSTTAAPSGNTVPINVLAMGNNQATIRLAFNPQCFLSVRLIADENIG